jgi:hypothetical protein
MNLFKRIIFSFLSLIISLNITSQTKIGQWRDHFSYSSCEFVAVSEEVVIGANQLGIFYYHKNENSYSRLNKTNNLHDVGICAIGQLLNDDIIIGYKNGNIDIVSGEKVTSIPDLKIKNLTGSKEFNHFYEYGDKVYCSMQFGIMVLNVVKNEIAETYFIGEKGSDIIVNQVTVYNDTIYAATESGILRAPVNSNALGDYNVWEETTGMNEGFSSVISFGYKLLSAKGTKGGTNIIYEYLGNSWKKIKTVTLFIDFTTNQNVLGIVSKNNVQVFNNDLDRVRVVSEYDFGEEEMEKAKPKSAIFDENGILYIADENFGVVRSDGENREECFFPDGPMSNNVFDVAASKSGVYVTAGGITSTWNNLKRPGEYSYFDGTKWFNFRRNSKDTTNNQNIWRDFLSIAIDPVDPERAYICSWGTGVFEVNAGMDIFNYNQYNSGLQNIDWTGRPYYVRVGGVAVDKDQNVWMNNGEVKNGLVLKTKDDKWLQYDYKAISKLHSMGQILISENNYFWMMIPRTNMTGLFVFDINNTVEDQSDDRYRCALSSSVDTDPRNAGQLKIWDENGEVITNKVYSLAEDKDGYIWVGTNKGVLVYYRPYAIFDEEKPVASRIKVPRNDGSNLADYLLENETVTSIAVDGGNRKWLGTANSGVFLVSEDGTKTIHSFNVDNSPLVSNHINSIAIHPETGEVFIGTDNGIVSYKALAMEGHSNFNKVYAYPNPVREDYSGDIIITGLMENSTLKIVDISGKLVFETTSVGGRAAWNGKNLHGNKVKTGVYVVFVSNEDGSEKVATKILIVN